MSDLYFHGSSTATSPEVTQLPSSESISMATSARLLHQPINTVTVMHSKRQLHQNWSRGVTSHSAGTKDTVEGYVLTKLVEWCLIWDVFTLEDMQQQAQHQSSLWNCADDLGWFHLWNTLHRSTEVSLFLTFLLIINSHLWLEMGNWCISLSNYKFKSFLYYLRNGKMFLFFNLPIIKKFSVTLLEQIMKLNTGIRVKIIPMLFALDNCTVIMYKNILVLRHFPLEH